jgi:hypothetical protein
MMKHQLAPGLEDLYSLHADQLMAFAYFLNTHHVLNAPFRTLALVYIDR